MSDTADADEDLVACEHCGKRTSYEESVPHVDVRLCSACDAEWRKDFFSCRHEWAGPTHDDHGEPGRYCHRCGGLVTDDDAMNLFPLVCDGWAEVPPA